MRRMRQIFSVIDPGTHTLRLLLVSIRSISSSWSSFPAAAEGADRLSVAPDELSCEEMSTDDAVCLGIDSMLRTQEAEY